MNVKSFLITLLFVASCSMIYAEQVVIKVRPGTGTLQRAINKAATKRGDVVIELQGGEYRTARTIEITQGKWNTLLIKPRQGESASVSGDVVVPRGKLKKVTSPAVLSLLSKEVQGKVLEVDCNGIAGVLGPIRPSGFGRKSQPAWSELIVNGKPLSLSRWPNDNMELIGKVEVAGKEEDRKQGRLPVFHYRGNHPKQWKNTANMWIGGYFGWGYADDMVPVKSINLQDSTIHVGDFTTYFFGTGTDFRRWFALNLIEEIDRPGEFVLDHEDKKFYFLPREEKVEQVRLTVLSDPLFAIERCKNVTLQGLTIENSRGIGVYMDNTESVLVQGCTIRNVGNVGVCIGKGTDTPPGAPRRGHAMEFGGEIKGRMVGDMMGKIYENTMLDREAGCNNGVKDCYIYNVGAGGVSLGGNGRATLKPAGNFVENCKISAYNRIEKSYRPGVWIDGVGNRVTGCDIFDAPSMAILFHGNDHVIEYCDITHVCQEVDDQGAIYYGRDPSERGNVIRYCYFHELSPKHRVTATYHDDGSCDGTVYGNIYYKAGSMPVLIGGGKDHKYYNNIFIDSPCAIHIDNRFQNWYSYALEKGAVIETRLNAVRYKEPPYSVRYPKLLNYWDEDASTPQRNLFHTNLFYKVGQVVKNGERWGEFWNNYATAVDPGFVDPDNPLKGFKPDAEVFKRIAGFKEPEYGKIGSTLPPMPYE